MKKLLLLASVALMGAGSMFGQEGLLSHDPATYADNGDYSLYNRWLISRTVSNIDAINNSFLSSAYARTATIHKDMVYVAQSVSELVEGSTTGDVLYRFDLATGESKGVLNLTRDGQPFYGLLSANTVGVDDYGHLYVASYTGQINPIVGGTAYTPLRIYLVDEETGAVTPLPEINPYETAGEEASTSKAPRIDYIDVIGDLTGEEWSCTVMAALNTDNLSVLRAVREQGSEEWAGGFDTYYFWDTPTISETCPMATDADAGTSSPQADWGTGPVVKMINDEEHIGESFYIDGFTTCPAIYNTQGAMLDSFNSCIGLAPTTGTNGITEFTLGSDNFAVWSANDYDKGHTCQVSIGTFGEGFDFKDLNVLYTFPVIGLGEQSDGGNRVHSVQAKKYTDNDGNEAVYILDYKCMNGLGVYVFAQKNFEDPNGGAGVEGIADDFSDAPAVYFNLQGQKIDSPAAGLYIVKRGNKVAKEFVK
ncbi:MAG: hypothetical protein K2M07_08725 [Muribaculaceae bacterium]|nr:hypothetical protein [Muribaculaceae bacterium]